MSGRVLANKERQAIVALFAKSQESGLHFAIVRGGDELPERLTGNDLDVFVPYREMAQAEKVLLQVMLQHGMKLIHRYSRSYFSAYWFIFENDLTLQPLHIDLYPGTFCWKGINYLTEEEILKEIIQKNGLPYVAEFPELCSLLLTSLLWGGFLKEKYQPQIRKLLQSDSVREKFLGMLRSRFGCSKISLNEFYDLKSDILAQRKISWKLRRRFLIVSLLKKPCQSIAELGKFIYGEIKAFLAPPGLCVTLLGPDGAGKTLLLHNLSRQMKSYFGSVTTFHWRPGLLPELGVLFKKRKPNMAPVENPHEKPPHGRILSLVRLIYYILDYYFGWLIKVWPAQSKNHLIIFDRYSYDMAIDPRRYRFHLPDLLLFYLVRFVPRPNIIVLLSGDAEVILDRKREIDYEDLKNILKRFEELITNNPSIIKIDCKLEPELICEIVTRNIEDVQTSRLKANRKSPGFAGETLRV